MTSRKEISINFLRLAAAGDSRNAFDQYVGRDFRHHNAYFKGDAQTLMTAMEEAAKQNPNKIFDIQRALEDGEFVAVHSRVRQNLADRDVAVIHIFRFRDDKIIELWDFGQAVPENSPNENGMF